MTVLLVIVAALYLLIGLMFYISIGSEDIPVDPPLRLIVTWAPVFFVLWLEDKHSVEVPGWIDWILVGPGK